MSKLPQHWIRTSLASICVGSQYGWTTKASDEGDIRFLRTTDIAKGEIDWASVPYCKNNPPDLDRYLIHENDILISRAGSVGFSTLIGRIPGSTVFASYLIRFIPSKYIEPRYIAYFLKSSEYWRQISKASSGIALSNINAKKLSDINTPLAPTNEQKRIADKLDNLLVRVDECRDRLHRVKQILELFRQAVITAGMSGQLTQDWQADSARDLKVRNQETVGKLANFAAVIDPNPSHRYPSYADGTIPLLATKQMVGLNDWDTTSAKLTTADFYEKRKAAHDFLDDDIIFARKGRLGLARTPPQSTRYTFSHSVFIIRAKTDNLLPPYLLWFLRQDWCIEWLLLEMNSNAGVPTLGKSVMESLPIRVPHHEEQKEIVRQLENLFSYADKIESYCQNAFTQVEQITTTILSKAFRGKLVDQAPNEESAAVLLKKIQVEQAAKPKEISRRRKHKMPKTSKKYIKEVIRQMPEGVFLFDELKKEIPGDYDVLKDALFALLDESEQNIMQVFDSKAGVMQFVRKNK